ncbi:extracellular solute-binding protein [Streptomyces sp. NBC_00038]|uniref:extracellular solute-binding protein n=1 Tax=Streptomyces sp. NBC_00038 TaxID=2903615 RepID=UPI00225C3E64|nr:extracellular solute-binding protein [Streptomyces sp. NBC_00038]MCX5557425.1 extracellular solute-binding protein [Streptomyces sp. NBC_00038]
MHRRARTMVTTAAALALLAGASGCGGSAGTESGATTLTVIATNYGDSVHKNSQGYWDRVALDFEAANPDIHVEAKVYPADTVDAKVAELVKQGRAPDVVQTGSYAEYASEGLLYSADELLSIAVQGSFAPSLTEAGQVQRTQYGLPFTASTRLLYYNKDLFARADLEPPTTWDELVAAAEVLKAWGVKYPIAVPLGPEEAEAETLTWLLAGDGGYTQGGTYTLTSDANVSTLEWLKSDLVGAGLTGPVQPGELNRTEALDAFVDGEAAMVNAPLSLIRQIEDSSLSVPYGTIPLPSRTGQTEPTMGTADWTIAFKQAGHREQTGRFLDFLYSDEYVTQQASEYQLLPVTASVSAAMRADTRYRSLWNGLDTLENMDLYPLSETNWSEVSAAIRTQVGAAVAPAGDPEAVLTSIAKAAR